MKLDGKLLNKTASVCPREEHHFMVNITETTTEIEPMQINS